MAGRLLLMATLLGFPAPDSSGNKYPHPDLLIEPADLAKVDVAKESVILDARTRASYEQGHVPGARWVDPAAWAAGFGDGDDAEGWSKRIGDLGIDQASKVVVYDDGPSKDAARIWWILRYWGVEDAKLLNGGLTGWKSGKFPMETEVQSPEPAEFTATPQAARLATKDQLLEALKGKSLQIVDARSEGEFCGTDKLKNKRAGAMPGAKHLEWSDLIDKQTQRFKQPAVIRELFDQAGIDVEQPTATHCQGGGRSSVMAFGLELMGATEVHNYYRGWGEWGNADDTPIEPGEPKNDAASWFRALEQRLARSKTLECDFEVKTALASFHGSLTLGEGNKARLEINSETEGRPLRLLLVSDGERTHVRDSGGGPWVHDTPRNQNADILTWLTIPGIFLPQTPLPDVTVADAKDRFRASGFKLGENKRLGGRDIQMLEYQLAVKGQDDTFSVAVWLDVPSGLPVKRTITSAVRGEKMTLAETYGKLTLDPNVDAKKFELPK